MSLYKRGRYWHFKFQLKGKSYRGTTGKTSRREATRYAAEYRAAVSQAVGLNHLTVADMMAHDIDRALGNGTTEKHVEFVEYIWANHIAEFFGAETHPKILADYDRLIAYCNWRRSSGVKGQTIRRELQAIRRGLKLAMRKGALDALPLDWPKLKSDPPGARRGRLIPSDELEDFLGWLEDEAKEQATFCALTGLRAAELRRVRGTWIRSGDESVAGWCVVPEGGAKTRTERWVPLGKTAMEVAQSAIRRYGRRSELFNREHKKAFAGACKELGIKQISLRDLRHTFLTNALQRTGDVVAVMAVGGHKNLRTAEIYQHSTRARAAKVVGDE